MKVTQAGVEYFCETSAEADAEVIALACHTLKDLGFSEIKIEMGHAGFFHEFIRMIDLGAPDVEQLKGLIQAKNIVELGPFLQQLNITEDIIDAIVTIPMLYGDPVEVSKRARKVVKTAKMEETLDYLLKVYEILKLYGLEDTIVLDLGLINHMGYYSDVIFQGFVEKFGKPVLMGGRYNHLGNEFGADLPAIGFACEVESLITALTTDRVSPRTPIDIKILYDDESLKQSIRIANELRERNYTVLSYPLLKASSNVQNSIYQLTISTEKNIFRYRDEQTSFQSLDELLKLLNGAKGAM